MYLFIINVGRVILFTSTYIIRNLNMRRLIARKYEELEVIQIFILKQHKLIKWFSLKCSHVGPMFQCKTNFFFSYLSLCWKKKKKKKKNIFCKFIFEHTNRKDRRALNVYIRSVFTPRLKWADLTNCPFRFQNIQHFNFFICMLQQPS